MVKVVHEHGGKCIEGEASGLGAGMLLLTSRKGNFLSVCPNGNVTAYNGLVQYDSRLKTFCKSVDAFVLPSPVTTATNRIHEAEFRHADGATERFRLSSRACHYELKGCAGEVFLDLDMRRLDDRDTRGRIYAVRQENEDVIVRYRKFRDDALRDQAYSFALVLHGVPKGAFRPIGEWQERRYQYDERRGDALGGWVYRAGAIRVTGEMRLIITHSSDEEKALAKAYAVTESEEAILQGLATNARNAYQGETIEQDLALASLDALTTKLKGADEPGILAGLPWFTQRWSRDELVSCGALIRAGHYELAKQLLMRYYAILDRPLTAHYPDGGLRAADSLGWLAQRTHELLEATEHEDARHHYFTKDELLEIHDRLAKAIDVLPLDRDDLVVNGPGETWMDAVVSGDTRAGVRVEIQAGLLAAFRLLGLLEQRTSLPRSLTSPYRKVESLMARRIREALFRDGMLLDGKDDPTVRPNVFLAYYLFPTLLSPDEWKGVFDRALERLWLPWGGLASIDRGHHLFQPRYTGMDDLSYHRGDSWYWVNALAAICLWRLDRKRYAPTITALRNACVHDLLFQGAVGHCSELSSASSQEWGGCFSQAWSAALLYELLREQ